MILKDLNFSFNGYPTEIVKKQKLKYFNVYASFYWDNNMLTMATEKRHQCNGKISISIQKCKNVYVVCCIIFLNFLIFHIQKGVHVKIGLKLNIRNMSSVRTLKHIIFYMKGLVMFYKSCFKLWSLVIGLKLNIRNMSSVRTLKHIIFYMKGLVMFYKSCFKLWSHVIGLKLNIRNMSSVRRLKHIIFYIKGLVMLYKSCFKRLIL